VLHWLWGAPWPLLALANLIWATSLITARAVSATIPPSVLSLARWGGAALLVWLFAWRHVLRDADLLRQHWRLMLLYAVTGFVTYNLLSNYALHYTTALNGLLLQSATPLMVLIGGFLIFRDRPRPKQVAGVLVSLLGVLAIAVHGRIEDLGHLSFNFGDAIIVGSLAVYGCYCVLLRKRPRVHPMSFLAVAFGLSAAILAPIAAADLASGALVTGGWPSVLAMLYMASFPSIVAYLAFNRGVELIGTARAGQSLHLIPLFGAALAILLLGEQPHLYHAAGFLLILAGLLLAR
jgi:drug/metabolite transporter (DMT)-like permease